MIDIDEVIARLGQHAPDVDNAAPVVAAVSCTNPQCDRRGQHHSIHADTVQPVMCGGCHAVMLCDHVDQRETHHYGGTLEQPMKATVSQCLACKTHVSVSNVKVHPRDVPLAAFRPGT